MSLISCSFYSTAHGIHHVLICASSHPLQELVVNSFVTNDTQLGVVGAMVRAKEQVSSTVAEATTSSERFSKSGAMDVNSTRETGPASSSDDAFFDNPVMILTGANSSGKSVYLKQVKCEPSLTDIFTS